MLRIFLLNVVWVGMQMIYIIEHYGLILSYCTTMGSIMQELFLIIILRRTKFSPFLHRYLYILFWSEVCYCTHKESAMFLSRTANRD
jgi:peptidoglycan biosynthesis protein MviN/MurJ (putative lipid II flippase)